VISGKKGWRWDWRELAYEIQSNGGRFLKESQPDLIARVLDRRDQPPAKREQTWD